MAGAIKLKRGFLAADYSILKVDSALRISTTKREITELGTCILQLESIGLNECRRRIHTNPLNSPRPQLPYRTVMTPTMNQSFWQPVKGHQTHHCSRFGNHIQLLSLTEKPSFTF
jgi:hypothetical protein